MKKQFENELSPEQRVSMRRNLVYIGIFSIIMLFAGFTSAYIVSMGDSFWVKYPFPPAFWISTVLLAVSSITLEIAIRLGRKGTPGAVKLFVPLTFLLGVGFAVYQFKGYGQLVDEGAYFTSKIMVNEGRYGDYYQLRIDGKYMEVDGSDYLLDGTKIGEAKKAEIGRWAKQLEKIHLEKQVAISEYGKYTLLYKNQEVAYRNGKLYVQDSSELQFVDLKRLAEFSWHLRDGRGDFFHKGTYGKDFKLYYKGTELDYKNRRLYYKGHELEPPLQLKLNDAPDQATSYLYIITVLHLLHVLGTLIFMLVMTIRSFTGGLEEHNYLTLRTGSVFWHFLGLLWLFLLLFLLFIH